jgi:hypothetical protein
MLLFVLLPMFLLLLASLVLLASLLLLDNAGVPAFAGVPAIADVPAFADVPAIASVSAVAGVSAVSLILLRLCFCWRPCSRLRHRICYPSSLVLLLPAFLLLASCNCCGWGVWASSLQLLTLPL